MSLLILTVIMTVLSGVVGVVVMVIGFQELKWTSFFIGLGAVLLAGWVSLVVTYGVRNYYKKEMTEVLLAMTSRMAILGTFIITVTITQPRSFVISTFCFLIVFYLGFLPVNVWLTTPIKQRAVKQGRLSDKNNVGEFVNHEH